MEFDSRKEKNRKQAAISLILRNIEETPNSLGCQCTELDIYVVHTAS